MLFYRLGVGWSLRTADFEDNGMAAWEETTPVG